MLVDPDQFKEETAPYPVLAAKRRSRCPHCLDTIMPGDAIVLRSEDTRYSHISCAEWISDLEADPNRKFVEELAKFRLQQSGCERPRPRFGTRKRKARA